MDRHVNNRDESREFSNCEACSEFSLVCSFECLLKLNTDSIL